MKNLTNTAQSFWILFRRKLNFLRAELLRWYGGGSITLVRETRWGTLQKLTRESSCLTTSLPLPPHSFCQGWSLPTHWILLKWRILKLNTPQHTHPSNSKHQYTCIRRERDWQSKSNRQEQSSERQPVYFERYLNSSQKKYEQILRKFV